MVRVGVRGYGLNHQWEVLIRTKAVGYLHVACVCVGLYAQQ